MEALLPASFFALDGFTHAPLFALDAPVWEALGTRLDDYLAAWADWTIASPLPSGVHLLEGRISIGRGCRVEPGAVLAGPLIIGDECEIRTGAYVRGRVVLGRHCIVGAHSEVKSAVFLDGARAPHQNYVGDSILGREVNLGAGTILSNVKNVGGEITVRCGESTRSTGMRKLGAVLGDRCKTGCNTVTNPGTLMGPGSVTYPNATVRAGLYPPGTMIKVRQAQQQTVITVRH